MAIEDPDLHEVYGPLSVRGADDGNSIAPPAGAAWFDIGLVRGNDGVGIVSATVTASRRLVVVLTDGTVIDAGSVGGSAGGGGDGVWIVSAKVNPSGHLIVTLSDGEVLDAGYVVGPPGEDGTDGTNGTDGTDGTDGLSAYQVAVSKGFVGTEAEWLASLVGPPGEDGTDGTDGTNGTNGNDGTNGLSAYQIAVDEGFVGTEAEWLASLKGPAGTAGPLQSLFDGDPVALTWLVNAEFASGSGVSEFTVSVTDVVQRETPAGGCVEFTTTANWTGNVKASIYVFLVPLDRMGVMLPYLSGPNNFRVPLGWFSQGLYGTGFSPLLYLNLADKGQPRVFRFYYLKM